MSIGNSLRTINTPMGDIVCEMCNDLNYPALYIYLRIPNNQDILLAAVEYETEDKTIGICSWFDMDHDDPIYHDRINEEDVRRYLSGVN